MSGHDQLGRAEKRSAFRRMSDGFRPVCLRQDDIFSTAAGVLEFLASHSAEGATLWPQARNFATLVFRPTC